MTIDDTNTTRRERTPARTTHATPIHAVARAAMSLHVEAGGRLLEVRRGDLLIANRLSKTQAVMNVSKDPWTHAALVGEVGGELVAIELGPKGCGSRTIRDFAAAYRIVGVGQPAMHAECIDAVASAAELHAAVGDLRYSWDACRVLESVALIRCFAPAPAERWVIRFADRWARRLLRREPPDALTCSGFVDLCLAAACPACRPAPVWPRRARTGPLRGMPSVVDLWRGRSTEVLTDSLIVRALSTPADLWLAGCWEHRVVHRPHRTTVLVDVDGRVPIEPQEHREEAGMNPNPNP